MKPLDFASTRSLVAAIGCTLFVTACSPSDDSGASTTPAETEIGPDHIEVALKFEVGKRYLFEYDMQFDTTFGETLSAFIPGGQQAKQFQVFAFDVVSETPNGGRNIEFQFLRHNIEIAMGGDKMVLDTDELQDQEDIDPLLAGIVNSVGHIVKLELNAENEVVSFSGIEELKAQAMQQANDQLKGMIQGIFSEPYIENVTVARGLPPGPVKPGDSWPLNLTQDLGILGRYVADQQFQFRKMEDHEGKQCAQIAFSGTVRGASSQKLKGLGPEMQITGGTTFGKHWYDPELGQFTDSDIEQTMQMTIEIPDIPMEALKDGGFKIEVHQKLRRRLLSIEPFDAAETETEPASPGETTN